MVKTTLSALITLTLVLAMAACGAKEEKAMENRVENIPGSAQPEVTSSSPAPKPGVLVWVYRKSGRKQCESGGMTLQQSLAKLRENGIAVQESRCGVRTDRMYPAVCGAPTGDILLHLVGMDALDAALELGFDPAEQVQYQFSACRDNSA